VHPRRVHGVHLSLERSQRVTVHLVESTPAIRKWIQDLVDGNEIDQEECEGDEARASTEACFDLAQPGSAEQGEAKRRQEPAVHWQLDAAEPGQPCYHSEQPSSWTRGVPQEGQAEEGRGPQNPPVARTEQRQWNQQESRIEVM